MGSMRLKKMGSWIQYSGPGGRPFYYNESTGFFQWERPTTGAESFPSMSTLIENENGDDNHINGHHIRAGNDDEEDEDEPEEPAWAYTDADAEVDLNSAAANKWNKAVSAAVEAGGGDTQTQGPWEQYEDEEGNWYWYNHETGGSQWTTPEGCVDPYEDEWEDGDEVEGGEEGEGNGATGDGNYGYGYHGDKE